MNQHRLPIEIPDVTRNDLASLFYELGYKIGAEIGVERGAYSEVLCKRNPNLKLYCVDAWAAYAGYREHVPQSKLDDFYEFTRDRLSDYDCELIRAFSMDAISRFAENSLDFVYLDANHEFQQVVNDISEWSKKVRPGGIISGHDFIRRKNKDYYMHVIEAVTGYTSSWQIRPWFLMGRKEAVERERRDKPRSWMWIKE